MVYIFSGEDIVSSRKAFLEHIERLKTEGFVVERVNGKDLTLESLEMLSSPTSLFGEKRAVAIENLLTLTKSKEKEKIINTIVSLLHCSIVVWESKDISKTDQLRYPKNFLFRNFKLPSVLFEFLDKLSPNKKEENLRLLQGVLDQVDPAYVFLMLIRQIRLLILCSDGVKPGLAPWQEGKLNHQAKNFTTDQLKNIYAKLLEIDYHQKTSSSAFALNSELDLLIEDI